MGCTTPVSLLAPCSASIAGPSESSAASSAARSIRPSAPNGASVAESGGKRCPASTQECSPAPAISRTAFPVGVSARLAASVPPDVKTHRTLRDAREFATARLASSMIERAARPSPWIEEGLPARSNAAAIAVRASARRGAVAL